MLVRLFTNDVGLIGIA